MRTIKYTNKFKKDFKREKAGQLGKKVESLLNDATDLLKVDEPLPDDTPIISYPVISAIAVNVILGLIYC